MYYQAQTVSIELNHVAVMYASEHSITPVHAENFQLFDVLGDEDIQPYQPNTIAAMIGRHRDEDI